MKTFTNILNSSKKFSKGAFAFLILNAMLATSLFVLNSCSNKENERIELERDSALNQYSKTTEFMQLKSMSSILQIEKASVINIPNKEGLKALTIPYVTGRNKIKFAVVYSNSLSEFNSENSKTLIIEVVNTNQQDVLQTIKSGQFDGLINIYDSREQLIYNVQYKQNLVVQVENSVNFEELEREQECSVDGVGSCAGVKFESAGMIEKAVCLATIVECMAIYAADCWIENCL